MKRIYFILCSLTVLFTACQDELQDVTYISNTEISAHSSTADVLIYVSNQDGGRSRATVEEFGVFLSTTANPTDKDERHSLVIKDENWDAYRQVYNEVGGYVFTIEGLSANTTYYALPFISNRWGIVTGKVVSFTTNGTAKVTTKAATQITTTTVQLNASVELVGENVNLEKRGFVMSTSSNPQIEDNNITNWAEVGKTGDYSVNIFDMHSSTRYYFRGYVVVDGETLYGNVLNFTTLTPDDAITLSLNNVTDITNNSAKVSGSITIGKDIVGQMTECGFLCSTNSNPTAYSYDSKWYYDSNTNNGFSTWSGQKNLSGTFKSLSQNTLYYYRMYYKIGTQYYYDNTIKSFSTTGSSQSYYTVSQIMSIYNSLDLSSGSTSTDTYTVRGYVTQWISGYPNWQNADFWIDDSANGSTSRLKCFRLTGVLDSDKRTLNVGDYIEAQNCHLMNYNGIAELKDGTFTVIKAAPAGVPSLSDYLGTYLCQVHREANDGSAFWDNVVISSYVDEEDPEFNILVEGLFYGYSAYAALGTFDEAKGYIRLWGAWYLMDHTCTLSIFGDPLINPAFYPCYIENGTPYLLENSSNSNNFAGEIILKKNSSGILEFVASDKADNNNRYANAYRFLYTYASDNSSTGHGSESFWLNGTTLTKTSSATSAPAMMRNRKVIRHR